MPNILQSTLVDSMNKLAKTNTLVLQLCFISNSSGTLGLHRRTTKPHLFSFMLHVMQASYVYHLAPSWCYLQLDSELF